MRKLQMQERISVRFSRSLLSKLRSIHAKMHSKIVLINYADGGFFESQKRNSDSALRVGKVDTVMAMGGQLSKGFKTKNAAYFKESRGAG